MNKEGSKRTIIAMSAEVGNWVQQNRVALGLRQKHVAEVLGVGVKVVSNIERGHRGLNDDEVKLLQKKLGFGALPVAQGASPMRQTLAPIPDKPFYFESEFFIRQQQFLGEAKSPYDLWILNPTEIPLLESRLAKDVWIENLSRGFNYIILWIVQTATSVQFGNFYRSARDVLRELSARTTDSGPSQGSIFVCVYKLPGIPLTPENSQFQIDYSQEQRQQHRSKPFILQPVQEVKNDESGKEIHDFLFRFYFRPAAVVVYKPRKPLEDKTMAAIEFRRLATFDEQPPAEGYLLLAKEHAEELSAMITPLEAKAKQNGF